MGHYADQFKGKTAAVEQTFFLNTGDTDDFARKFPFPLKFPKNNLKSTWTLLVKPLGIN